MPDLVVTVRIAEHLTGLWCYQCSLPSAERITLAIGSHGTSKTIHRCTDDPTHVLLDEPTTGSDRWPA